MPKFEDERLGESLTVGKNSYFIKTDDRRINGAEMARLGQQDKLMNKKIDLFPDGYSPTSTSAILDVACGPGGYLRDIALKHPCVHLVGIDNNRKVIQFARDHEQTAHNPYVRFELGNILDPLAFPDESFDFVNARFVTGVLSTNEQEWTSLISECRRLLKPGGYLRMIESEMSWVPRSPVTNQMINALMQVMWRAGKSFAAQQIAVTPMISAFFRACGLVDIHQSINAMDWSHGTDMYPLVVEDTLSVTRVTRGSMISMGGIPEDAFDVLYQQMATELKSEQFRATWPIVIVQGCKPL